MRHKVIVYGLGRNFAKRYAEIHDLYDVVGYCDADFSKVARFRQGISLLQLKDYCRICDSIIVTLASGIRVVRELTQMGIPAEKIQILSNREKHNLLGNRNPLLPQLISHGSYHADLALMLSCYYFKLDMHNMRYFEAGLEHIIDGSATYVLYGNGSKGRLVVHDYPACQNQAQVFRPKDEIVIMKSLDESTASKTIDNNEKYDVIVLHGEKLTEMWLPFVLKIKPQILICCTPHRLMVQDVVSHDFNCGISLGNGVSLYYSSCLDEVAGV